MKFHVLRSWVYRSIWVGAAGTLSMAALLTLGYLIPRQWNAQKTCDADRNITIYVSGNAFHTNLVVPVQTQGMDWHQHLDLTTLGQEARDDYQFLTVGWGDREFYMNTPTVQDFSLITTLRAMLWPTDTVLHIQGFQNLPPETDSHQIQALQISQTAYQDLTEFILASFDPDETGNPILIQESHRYTGSFFAAQGIYSIFRTCNDWTAIGLRKAQVNTPLWSGLAPAIFRHAQNTCPK